MTYLASIGQDVAKCVELIIATHWHDDHISGLAKAVEACRSAKFCCSAAMTGSEFLGMVAVYQSRPGTSFGPGVREIDATVKAMDDRAPIKRALQNVPLLSFPAAQMAHGRPCVITALSPSDLQLQKSLDEIAGLIPGVQTKRRAVPQNPNHLTVVTWVEVGDLRILLGGDLEETADPNTGWSVIVASTERPQGKAAIFKIPHHGSRNGHSDGVWADMLARNPFAILAPWNRSSRLPTTGDVERILNHTQEAYSTAPVRVTRSHMPRSPAVTRQLREMGVSLRKPEPATGAIRLRNAGPQNWDRWAVDLRDEACHLSKVFQ